MRAEEEWAEIERHDLFIRADRDHGARTPFDASSQRKPTASVPRGRKGSGDREFLESGHLPT